MHSKDLQERLLGHCIVVSVAGAILSFLGKVVGFIGKHTWALIVFVVGFVGWWLM